MPPAGGLHRVRRSPRSAYLHSNFDPLAAWAAEHCAIDGGQAVASLLGSVRAVGQDDACRRLPARDPIGHDQLYQAARCGLCLIERRGIPPPLAEVLPCTVGRHAAAPARRPIAACCSGTQRRLTDA